MKILNCFIVVFAVSSFTINTVSAQDALVVDDTGYVGVGTASPGAPLDVNIGSTTPGPGNSVLRLARQGPLAFQFDNTDEAFFWNFSSASGEFRISRSGTGVREMALNGSGDLVITGNYFSTTCVTPCAPDYVFEEDYNLMSLGELEKFIESKNHLPNIPSAKELVGPINISDMQMRLLAKIEELTLYTIEQDKKIKALEEKVVKH